MRWLLAGLLFALVVGLAIATAAVKADNVRHRRRLQELWQEREAWLTRYRAERVRLREDTDLHRLDELWQAYIERHSR